MPNKYPIALAHGIARFDAFRQRILDFFENLQIFVSKDDDNAHYFRHIASHLKANGIEVRHTNVQFAASVKERAAKLKEEIENKFFNVDQPPMKVHIIAHSMGGLDARYMIANLGIADKIASLTTIGTPHHGTSLADKGIAFVEKNAGKDFLEVFKLEGFADLTTAACEKFNVENEAKEASNNVFYQVYASFEQKDLIFEPWQKSWQIIRDCQGVGGGDNDGLVPIGSQLWKPFLLKEDGAPKTIIQNFFPFPADHLNQIGWFEKNEFRSLTHFTLNPIKLARFALDYERKVRDVYLQIAKTVQALDDDN